MAGKRQNVHVVPRSNGWAVVKEGNARASKLTQTQRPAIDYGRQVAKQEKSELNIHGVDGRIRAKDSYGNDPYPPKG